MVLNDIVSIYWLDYNHFQFGWYSVWMVLELGLGKCYVREANSQIHHADCQCRYEWFTKAYRNHTQLHTWGEV